MKKKIVWVASGPNNIYLNFSKGLNKYKDIEVVLIVGKEKENDPNRVSYNRIGFENIIELQKIDPLFNLVVFFPLTLWNLFKKLPARTDMPTLINLKDLDITLGREKPDIVISTTHFKKYSSIAEKFCRKTGTPFILQSELKGHPKGIIMGYLSRFSVLFHSGLFTRAIRIFTWSKAAAEHHKEYPVSDEKVIQVIPGYDPDKFYPVDVEKDKNYIDILLVSRLVPFKNTLDVVKAIHKLVQQEIYVYRLTILGKGPLKKKIEKYIKKHHLEKNILFHDLVPQDKLKELYSRFDLSILASYNEELGMVVLESMACGTPVIVSDTSGAASYVTHGEDGFIFDTGDVSQLSRYIKNFHETGIREKMSKKAAENAKDKFTIDKTSETFYQEVMNAIKEWEDE